MNTQPSLFSRPGTLGRLAALALLAALPWPAIAQAQVLVPGASDNASLQQLARDWIEPALAAVNGPDGAGPLRPELVMGTLDGRLRLTPCAQIEPYVPVGTRLWGRSRIGLRCVEGAVRWNVFLPLTVKAWGPAWVIKRQVPAGTTLSQDDAERAEVDWAEQASSVLATPERWVGQQAAFVLQPGTTLRQAMVRPTPAFPVGAQVRVSSTGAGFHIVVSGEALAAGVEGQTVKVRLNGGRVVTGTVKDGQTVEVRL